jgi:hypothetical protein
VSWLTRPGNGAALRRAVAAANPVAAVDHLRQVRHVAEEMFQAGGAVIETPAGRTDGEPVSARTVIQPDGDVLHFIDRRELGNGPLLAAHAEVVDAWYRRASDAFGAVQSMLGAAGRALAAGVGVVAAVVSALALDAVVGLVVVVVVPLALRVSTRLAVRIATRSVRRALAG